MDFRRGVGEARREALWFGTVQKAGWFRTPNAGADASPVGWVDEGALANGGGFVFSSFASHKQYVFEWRNVAVEVAQRLKSYADGTYGRGLLYFHLPNTYSTNVLPASWADPSMGVGVEGVSLVQGVDPVGSVQQSGVNELPVMKAVYDLGDVEPGFREGEALFVPIPKDYTLLLGGLYTSTGSGGVFVTPALPSGLPGVVSTKLTELPAQGANVVSDEFAGVSGVYLWVGKQSAGAGAVTLSGLVGRLVRSADALQYTVGTNLFRFSSLNKSAGSVEIRRNYAPIIEPSGTWAEVRRNLVTNPSPSAATGWNVRWQAASWTITPMVENGVPFIRFSNAGAPSAGALSVGISTGTAGVLGTVYSAGVEMRTSIPVSHAHAAFNLPRESFSMPANEWTRISRTGAANGTNSYLNTGVEQPLPVGTVVDIRLPVVEASPLLGGFFDGATLPDIVQPEDFRTRWLGAENESESVLEIETVAGLTATNCVAGVSTKAGKPAVRIIPNSTSTLTYAWIAVPAAARSGGTALGTIHLDGPLSGGLNVDALTLRVHSPVQKATAPNEAGAYPLRLRFSEITSGNTLRLYHGGAQGSGDVWWTDIGLYAGDYDGPNLQPDTEITDPDMWIERDGNNAVLMGEKADGFPNVNNLKVIQSQQYATPGTKSVRFIPDTPGVIGTADLTEGWGTLNGSTFVANFYKQGGDATVGIYNVVDRVETIDDNKSTVWVHDPDTGNPGVTVSTNTELWMNLPTLVEDTGYTNIPFTGGYGSNNITGTWTGLPDESTVIATYMSPALRDARTGPWVGGQGHSGCRFVNKPTYVEVGPDRISMACTLKEVGAWASN